jgi:hypothetical protein
LLIRLARLLLCGFLHVLRRISAISISVGAIFNGEDV